MNCVLLHSSCESQGGTPKKFVYLFPESGHMSFFSVTMVWVPRGRHFKNPVLRLDLLVRTGTP